MHGDVSLVDAVEQGHDVPARGEAVQLFERPRDLQEVAGDDDERVTRLAEPAVDDLEESHARRPYLGGPPEREPPSGKRIGQSPGEILILMVVDEEQVPHGVTPRHLYPCPISVLMSSEFHEYTEPRSAC